MEQQLWTCEPPCTGVFDRPGAFRAHLHRDHPAMLLATPGPCADCGQPTAVVRGARGLRCEACYSRLRSHFQGM